MNKMKRKPSSSQINNILQQAPKAYKLSEEFDVCLLGVRDGCLVYDAEQVINVLYATALEEIKEGNLPIYSEGYEIEESAWTYAVEDFDYNFEGVYVQSGPLYHRETDSERLET